MRFLAAFLLTASAAQAAVRPAAPRAKAPAAPALSTFRIPAVPASIPNAPLAAPAPSPSALRPAIPQASEASGGAPAVLPAAAPAALPRAASRKPAAFQRAPSARREARPSLRRTSRFSAALEARGQRAGGISGALWAFFDGGVPDLALMGQEGADILRGLRSQAFEAVSQARGGSMERLSDLPGEVSSWILKSQGLGAVALPAWLSGREHPEAPGGLLWLEDVLAGVNDVLPAFLGALPSPAAAKLLPLSAARVRVLVERRKRSLADIQAFRARLISRKAGDLRHVGAYHEGRELRVLARVAELATPRQLAAVLLHEELARVGLPHPEVAAKVLEITEAAFGPGHGVTDEELTRLALRAYPRLSQEAVSKLAETRRRRKVPRPSDEFPFAEDLKTLSVQNIETQAGLAGPKVTSLRFAAQKSRYLELLTHEGRVWLVWKGARRFNQDFVVMPQDGYDAGFLQKETDGTEVRQLSAASFAAAVFPVLREALQRHLDRMGLTYSLRAPAASFLEEVQALLRGAGAAVYDAASQPPAAEEAAAPAEELFGPVRLRSLRVDDSSEKEGRASLFFRDPDGRRVELRVVTKSGESRSEGLYAAAYEDITYRDPSEAGRKREIWLFWKDVSGKDWRRAEIVSDLEAAGAGDDSGEDVRRVSAARFRDEYLDYFQEAVRARMGRASEDGAAAAGFMVRFRKVLAVIEGEEGV